MLESIAIRRLETEGRPLDIGLLAETLLFYGKIHLILDHGSLVSLLRTLGPDHLLYLLDNGLATGTYYRQTLGVSGQSHIYDFIGFEFAGSKDKGRIQGKRQIINHIFETALSKSRATQRYADRFLRSVSFEDMTSGFNHDNGIVGLARQDLDDDLYVKEAISGALNELLPGFKIKQRWNFKIYRNESGFVFDTNLDFDAINSEYHKRVPPEHSSITPAYLATHLLQARADICLASASQSEFVTTPVSSRIIQIKFANILEKQFKSASEIQLFQEVYIGNGRAIRESINSGEKTFAEFIEVLERSTKFKQWLNDREPNENLLREYHKAVTADTWVDCLPTKGVRFTLFTGAGMLVDLVAPTGLGTAAGLAVSAGDTFILDKFLKGWKPNQFVEGPLTNFVKN